MHSLEHEVSKNRGQDVEELTEMVKAFASKHQ